MKKGDRNRARDRIKGKGTGLRVVRRGGLERYGRAVPARKERDVGEIVRWVDKGVRKRGRRYRRRGMDAVL